ncbi:MAG: fibronectin type III domain-containing protein [Clostridia bacterium]|nr:fibronectin type III domain-containing protein [Clostridia bacterium]
MNRLRKIFTLIVSVIMIGSLLGTGSIAEAVSVAAPTKITATATSDSVTLKWSKVSKASGYRVYLKQSGKWQKLKSQSAVSYTAKDLTASTTYTFGIKTYRKSGGKTYWAKLKTVKVKTKAMPDIKTPSATATKDSVTIKWDKVAGATGYRVYQYKNKKWVKIKSTTANKYTVKSLKSATTYKFKVKPYAKTDSGTVWGDTSKAVSVKTIDPTKTKITSCSAGTTSVSLKWSKVSGATGYRVSVLEKGEWKRVKSTTALSYKITGLDSNKEYSFAVRAYKKVGTKVTWYTQSNAVKVVTKAGESDLKAYRIEKYKSIFSSDVLYIKMSTNDPDMGTLPVEFARKNGSLAMKATLEGMDARIVYNKKEDKSYMIIDSLNMYMEMSKEDMESMDMQSIIEGMAITNVGDITVTQTTYGGKNAICESYTDTATGDKVNYYFIADELIASERIYPGAQTEKIDFVKISTSVDDSLFASPPWYYINMGAMTNS